MSPSIAQRVVAWALMIGLPQSVVADSKAAMPRNDVLPVPSAMARSCQQALSERTVFAFANTPLLDVKQFLSDFHQISIQIDHQAIMDAGLTIELPITAEMQDIRLKTGLRLLLRPHGLDYLVNDDCLLITTRDAAAEHLFMRTYPIGDLAKTPEEIKTLIDVIRQGTGDEDWDGHSPTRQIVGVATVQALVVWQNAEMHDRVRELLLTLRQAKQIAEGGEWPAEQLPPPADTEAAARVKN